MYAIDHASRQPRNLVAVGDNLQVSAAIELSNAGGSYSLPDTATKRLHTLAASCGLFSLRLDVTALIAVGPAVTAGTTPTAALGPGSYVIRCPNGSKVLVQRYAGTDATSYAHVAELI